MRVRAATKEQTRQSILNEAHKLFCNNGFEQTSTREIAALAGIAAGTLFNYFATKEALGVSLLAEGFDKAREDYSRRDGSVESLAEDLFLYVACCLRHLEPHRDYIPPIVETALSPFLRAAKCEDGERVRIDQLQRVGEILRKHGVADPSTVSLHLYWTLFLGVLAYWSRDSSPKQEDTLALLDQSTRLFVASLESKTNSGEVL